MVTQSLVFTSLDGRYYNLSIVKGKKQIKKDTVLWLGNIVKEHKLLRNQVHSTEMIKVNYLQEERYLSTVKV